MLSTSRPGRKQKQGRNYIKISFWWSQRHVDLAKIHGVGWGGGGGDETPICKMGRNIWADGKYVHNHDYSPSSVYSSAKKWIWSPLSRVQQPLVLCSAKIGVFSRKLIENVFTLIRKLAAGAIIASTTELAVIVINCIGHNSRNSVQDEVKQIQVLGTKFCQI